MKFTFEKKADFFFLIEYRGLNPNYTTVKSKD
jgi:hypothetical protein